MSERSMPAMPRPEMDDRRMWEMLAGIVGYPAVLVSHDLKLFSLLAKKPHTLPEVCEALGLAPRPVSALLSMNASLGLVHLENEQYSLTPYAASYLVESSPLSFTGFLDVIIATYAVYAFDSLRKAALTDAPQARPVWAAAHKDEAERGRRFTLGMHSLSMGPALAWPEAVDLSGHRLMLDIGGGSGAHAIGASQRWPALQAIVLDQRPACEAAGEIIKRHGLQDRIATQVCDYWEDTFPPADLHFYSMIYQNHRPERARLLAHKSLTSLAPGGRIIIHEMLLNEDKSGPLAAAAFNIIMLEWTQGQQYTGRELSEMLVEVGFTDVAVKPTTGYWSIVTARKP